MSSLSENSAALGRRRPEKRGFYQLCKGRKRPTGWLCSLCALRAVPAARGPHVHELSEDTVRRFAASFLAHQLSLVCVCHVGPQTVLPAWPGQATARDSRVRCCCVNVPLCGEVALRERPRVGGAPGGLGGAWGAGGAAQHVLGFKEEEPRPSLEPPFSQWCLEASLADVPVRCW